MTSPIEPIRRTARTRRADRAPETEVAATAEIEDRSQAGGFEPRTEAHAPAGADGTAGFAAQVLGQDSQRRGQHGGPAILDAAKTAYTRTEWSGPLDRRARKGAMTRTEI